MSFLDEAKAAEAAENQTVTPETVAPEEAGEKKLSTQALYHRKVVERQNKAAATIKEWVGNLDPSLVTDEVKEAISVICKEKKVGTGNTPAKRGQTSVLQTLFPDPQVGQEVDALTVFEKTGKGIGEMKMLIKRTKGMTIEYDSEAKKYRVTAVNPE